MKRKITWSVLTFAILLGGVFLNFTQHAAPPPPLFVTTFDVDRNDDVAGAGACTVAPNDCSLRGAIIAANADLNADPVIINVANRAQSTILACRMNQPATARTSARLKPKFLAS